MARSVRFLIALLAGLGILTALGHAALARITSHWFSADLALRGSLAIQSAEASLLDSWSTSPTNLENALRAIARDERIFGARACDPSGRAVASTPDWPEHFSCQALQDRAPEVRLPSGQGWSFNAEAAGGPVHVFVMPLARAEQPVGFVALLHDWSFVARRDATTRLLSVGVFFVLALLASLMTWLVARLTWRDWTKELRAALHGKSSEQFLPLMRDVRELARQLAEERADEGRAGTWSAARLRAALREHLRGEKVVILANREPYIHERDADGIRVVHPASGLVTALEPVMRACSGVWVAHGGGSADRETVDASDRVLVPPGEGSYWLRRVWLTEAEEAGYYYGLSNEGLWPLCHVAHARPSFQASDWEHYVRVNQKFADAVSEEVDVEDPIILIQDYHFALAPKMIRENLPKATIITFWHIPWPNAERIGICPWREQLITGLLGSSILGFHTQQHCNNFIDSVDAFLESRIDREQSAIIQAPRRTLIRPYPISIEWPVHWLSRVPPVDRARLQIREQLGLPPDALLGVGIDRLDYTKGIEERLMAVDELLTRHPEFQGRFTFVQLAAPSRTKIARYQELSERVEQLTEEINAKWSRGSYRPIVLLRSHHEPISVFEFYRAAEFCYVSSLHDGMNLVAKEFVAAREDEHGVLILSQFTGAARDLTEALLVNPYDLRQAADAMARALRMPGPEQTERMRSMRRLVSEFNVYRWAGRMLIDAAELRRKERMSGRFKKSFDGPESEVA